MHLLLIFSSKDLPIQSLEKKVVRLRKALLSHGGDHYDHRTDFQYHDSAGTEYGRCQECSYKSDHRGKTPLNTILPM